MHYCRTLEFTDKPDYKGLKKEFTEYFTQSLTSKEFLFDWQIKFRSKEPQRINSNNILPIHNKEEKASVASAFKGLSSNILRFNFADIKELQTLKQNKQVVPCTSVGPPISNNNGINITAMDFCEREDNKTELAGSKGKLFIEIR